MMSLNCNLKLMTGGTRLLSRKSPSHASDHHARPVRHGGHLPAFLATQVKAGLQHTRLPIEKAMLGS